MEFEARYSAFISYRHLPRDQHWARRIMAALEAYRTPRALRSEGFPDRLGQLFRDDDEIPVSQDLSEQIKEALSRSSNLIVVCSPETSASMWVRREIELFQEMGKGDRILPLLIAGEPDQSFPPELRRRRVKRDPTNDSPDPAWEVVEPVAADVRPRAGETSSRTEKRALLRLAAAMLGCSYDNLAQRESEYRRQILVRRAAVTAAIILAIGLTGWRAIQQSNLAHRETEIAASELAQKLKVRSIAITNAARQALADGDGEKAMLLALRAIPSTTAMVDHDVSRDPTYPILQQMAFSDTLLAEISTGYHYDNRATRELGLSFCGTSDVVPHDADHLKAAWAAIKVVPGGKDGINRILWTDKTRAALQTIAAAVAASPRFDAASPTGGMALKIGSMGSGVTLSYAHVPGFDRALMAGGSINAAVFSPDSMRILIASSDGVARLWDMTGNLIASLHHRAPVTAASFSPDNKLVVTVSEDGSARFWDAASGAKAQIRGSIMLASPDSTRMVVLAFVQGRQMQAELHDMTIGQTLSAFPEIVAPVMSPALQAAFSGDSARLAFVSRESNVMLFDADTGHKIGEIVGQDGPLANMTFSPNGKDIATLSRSGIVRLWNIASGKQLLTLPQDLAIESIAFSADGARILSRSLFTARIWDANSGKLVRQLDGHAFRNPLITDTDGTVVVTQFDEGAYSSYAAQISDFQTGAPLSKLNVEGDEFTSISFSPDHQMVATASGNAATVYDTKGGRTKFILKHGDIVQFVSFSVDHKWIATASHDHTTRIWNASTGVLVATLSQSAPVNTVVFTSDSTRLVTTAFDGFKGETALWDAGTWSMLAAFPGNPGVQPALINKNGTRVLTPGNGRLPTLWKLPLLGPADLAIYASVIAPRKLTDAELAEVLPEPGDAASEAGSRTIPGNLDDAARCDRLSADPWDPSAPKPGAFRIMNVHEAEQACEDAVEEHTVAARYIYQYGRALDEDRDGNAYERATDQFQESAELNYPAAWYQLGKRGVMWRTQHPKELLQAALKQGVIPAVTALAAGSANNEEMLHWLHQGEELGDPLSEFHLAEVYECGRGVGQDTQQALLHYIRATRGFEMIGDESDAQIARQARASLARSLEPEVAVKIARQANDSKRNGQ